jgi:uncharacterized protein YndB with AHSA1/START domain
MATNRIFCHASPETVFEVLADPRPYAYFVVGTRRIRRFDPHWPQPGARFHHSLGVAVTLIRDRTESLDVVDGRRIAMRTYMRPVALNDVVFDLEPQDGGTLVTLEETAVGGPGALPLLRGTADHLFKVRNVLVLHRLCRVVEERERRAQRAAGSDDDA